MANYRWRGNGAGDKSSWYDGRNWVNDAGTPYAEAMSPGATGTDDVAIFDLALGDGASSTAGVTGTEETIQSLIVSEYYDGTLGTEEDPINLQISGNSSIDASSAGGVYFDDSSSAGECSILGGTVRMASAGNLVCLRGTIAVADYTVLSSITVAYRQSKSSDVRLTIGEGVTCYNFTILGGYTESTTELYYIDVMGGTVVAQAGANTINMYGGTLIWSIGNISTAYCYGGTIDGSQSAGGRTIDKAYVYQGSTLDLRSPADDITVITAVVDNGGQIYWPFGSELNRV